VGDADCPFVSAAPATQTCELPADGGALVAGCEDPADVKANNDLAVGLFGPLVSADEPVKNAGPKGPDHAEDVPEANPNKVTPEDIQHFADALDQEGTGFVSLIEHFDCDALEGIECNIAFFADADNNGQPDGAAGMTGSQPDPALPNFDGPDYQKCSWVDMCRHEKARFIADKAISSAQRKDMLKVVSHLAGQMASLRMRHLESENRRHLMQKVRKLAAVTGSGADDLTLGDLEAGGHLRSATVQPLHRIPSDLHRIAGWGVRHTIYDADSLGYTVLNSDGDVLEKFNLKSSILAERRRIRRSVRKLDDDLAAQTNAEKLFEPNWDMYADMANNPENEMLQNGGPMTFGGGFSAASGEDPLSAVEKMITHELDGSKHDPMATCIEGTAAIEAMQQAGLIAGEGMDAVADLAHNFMDTCNNGFRELEQRAREDVGEAERIGKDAVAHCAANAELNTDEMRMNLENHFQEHFDATDIEHKVCGHIAPTWLGAAEPTGSALEEGTSMQNPTAASGPNAVVANHFPAGYDMASGHLPNNRDHVCHCIHMAHTEPAYGENNPQAQLRAVAEGSVPAQGALHGTSLTQMGRVYEAQQEIYEEAFHAQMTAAGAESDAGAWGENRVDKLINYAVKVHLAGMADSMIYGGETLTGAQLPENDAGDLPTDLSELTDPLYVGGTLGVDVHLAIDPPTWEMNLYEQGKPAGSTGMTLLELAERITEIADEIHDRVDMHVEADRRRTLRARMLRLRNRRLTQWKARKARVLKSVEERRRRLSAKEASGCVSIDGKDFCKEGAVEKSAESETDEFLNPSAATRRLRREAHRQRQLFEMHQDLITAHFGTANPVIRKSLSEIAEFSPRMPTRQERARLVRWSKRLSGEERRSLLQMSEEHRRKLSAGTGSSLDEHFDHANDAHLRRMEAAEVAHGLGHFGGRTTEGGRRTPRQLRESAKTRRAHANAEPTRRRRVLKQLLAKHSKHGKGNAVVDKHHRLAQVAHKRHAAPHTPLGRRLAARNGNQGHARAQTKLTRRLSRAHAGGALMPRHTLRKAVREAHRQKRAAAKAAHHERRLQAKKLGKRGLRKIFHKRGQKQLAASSAKKEGGKSRKLRSAGRKLIGA
jgi:hypothetical protein